MSGNIPTCLKLARKLLISIATDEGQIFYHLLETTRAYVFDSPTAARWKWSVSVTGGILQMRPAQTTLSLWSRRRVRASPCTHIARADGRV
jgi:hypothetical protein